MNISKVLISAAIVLAMASCSSKYAKVEIVDANPTNKKVYGEIDGEPHQKGGTYPAATPETVESAAKFRSQVEATVQK